LEHEKRAVEKLRVVNRWSEVTGGGPYSPLGRGFLAGGASKLADDDFRKSLPRWQGDRVVRGDGRRP
jgi:hypothetical protein